VLAGWLFCLALSLWRPGLFPTICPSDRRRTLYVLVCMGVIPATVAALKDATNVFYPYKVERYGGKLPYRKLIYSLYQRPGEPHSRGFPAGHASGGFAMLCLAYVARTRRGRRQAVLAGMLAGWIPGVYQMAKGAHYLSHTVVTMLLAWIIAAAFARWFGLPSTAMEPVALWGVWGGPAGLIGPAGGRCGGRRGRMRVSAGGSGELPTWEGVFSGASGQPPASGCRPVEGC